MSASPLNPATSGTGRHGLFIAVEVDQSVAGDPQLAAKLAEVCPVDIYAAGDNGVEIVEKNLDECVLCQLCIEAAPPGTVKVIKLYDDGAVLGA
ncbi:MAG TPA: ferredoxin family protein [Solirubrobacteraceae bacterium]|nr:ferredoxin family protein [Solirubrobacteraceae bacterium]